MSKDQTLGEALDAVGHGDQKSLATDTVLNLTKDNCSKLLSGEDVGLSDYDKKSFNKLIKQRVNNGQPILPYKNLKVGGDMDPNW